ncbi:MAG: ankyrin repeat domain-containing protein [Treponema sp.]|nr:ankyrin repeat domain-containing protein [Treponema sp.]
MKVLFLHDKSGIKTAKELLDALKKKHIPGILYCPGENDRGGEVFLPEDFSAVTHVVTVFSDFPAFIPGLFFSQGFVLGAKVPLVRYGPGSGDPRLLKEGIPVKTRGDFIAYVEGESKKLTGEDAGKKAKFALLEMGIPYNEGSLENCIREGQAQALVLFLEAGFSPNIRNKSGVPLLSLAARTGNRHMVNILLKAGAEVNLRAEDRGSSALIDGAMGKHSGIVEDLLAAGADVNIKSKDGQSALVISVGLNDVVCAEMLLKAGADPDDPDSLGASARRYALLFNKPDMVALFNIYALQ